MGIRMKPGDPVNVPWGLDTVTGTVLSVYGPRARPHALVSIPIRGAEGEVLDTTTVSFPLDALTPAL